MISLIQLSESDKRLIFAFLLIFILLLVLLSTIGSLVVKSIKKQGKKIETSVYDVVVTRVVTDKKAFKKYAKKKNWRLFYKSSKIALIIMLISFVILMIRNFIFGWDYNPFNKEDGFGTLLFLWDFSDPACYSEFFGIKLLAKWPPLINSPHFVIEAWAAYLFVPGMLVGLIWYLTAVQGLIARSLHIKKLSETLFEKNLSNYNQNEQLLNTNQNQTNNNAQ